MITSHSSGRVICLRYGRITPVYQVAWMGRLCAPTWHQIGPAEAYLEMLANGKRKPEYQYKTTEDK